jgi:hypothetical protein
MIEFCFSGGRSSVGRVPDCDSGCRGFEPRRSPQYRFSLKALPCKAFKLSTLLYCERFYTTNTLTPYFLAPRLKVLGRLRICIGIQTQDRPTRLDRFGHKILKHRHFSRLIGQLIRQMRR